MARLLWQTLHLVALGMQKFCLGSPVADAGIVPAKKRFHSVLRIWQTDQQTVLGMVCLPRCPRALQHQAALRTIQIVEQPPTIIWLKNPAKRRGWGQCCSPKRCLRTTPSWRPLFRWRTAATLTSVCDSFPGAPEAERLMASTFCLVPPRQPLTLLQTPTPTVPGPHNPNHPPPGNMQLQFLHTAMMHWPDSMMALLREDALLFSQDGFGCLPLPGIKGLVVMGIFSDVLTLHVFLYWVFFFFFHCKNALQSFLHSFQLFRTVVMGRDYFDF